MLSVQRYIQIVAPAQTILLENQAHHYCPGIKLTDSYCAPSHRDALYIRALITSHEFLSCEHGIFIFAFKKNIGHTAKTRLYMISNKTLRVTF